MSATPKQPLVLDMTSSAGGATGIADWETGRERTGLFVLSAVLMFGPLAFGATEPWSQFIQRTVALALFALWGIRQYRSDKVELFPAPISWPVLAFGAIVLLQLVAGQTAYRYATLSESLNLIAYGAFALIAGELFRRRRNLRTFAEALGIFGAAVAIFAIIQGLSGTGDIYWLRPINVLSASIYGPYVNHNHYAGLMEMLIPFAAAISVMERGGKRALLLFATAIMVLSVGLSRSRGGMIALAAELLFVCVVLFRVQRNRRAAITVLAVAAAISAFVLVLGSDRILSRLAETQDAYRLKIYRDSLTMALQKPVLGYGLGTFSEVYPPFRSFYGNTFVNHAHNDYLELLVEMGIVGLTLFIWMLYGVFRSGLAKSIDPDDPEGRMLTLAALTGITGILVHSCLDFNLHIPANAALFFTLCAAVAVPFQHRIRPAHFVEPESEDCLDDELPS